MAGTGYAGGRPVDEEVPLNRLAFSALSVTESVAWAERCETDSAGVQLADGSMVWAFVGSRGRLYVRRPWAPRRSMPDGRW